MNKDKQISLKNIFDRCLNTKGQAGVAPNFARTDCYKLYNSQVWTPRFVGEETYAPSLFDL